jgi:hypothetical protein
VANVLDAVLAGVAAGVIDPMPARYRGAGVAVRDGVTVQAGVCSRDLFLIRSIATSMLYIYTDK